MVPKVNARGFSFKGVALYLTNDTPDMEPGAKRVLWSETANLLTDDITTAAKVMAWTDIHADDLKRASGQMMTGAKPTAGAVYHYSVAWAVGEEPTRDHMADSVRETIAALGLSDHEYFMVAHGDKPFAHVHVVVNLTHPETGKRAALGRDYVTLQKWASGYEREHGLHCHVREENAERREAGEKVKHQQQKRDYAPAVTRAFQASDNGAAFIAALEAEGLQLGKAKRGNSFVVVDEFGDIQALSRQLDIEQRNSAKTAAIAQKLADIDLSQIADGEDLARQIKADRGRAFHDDGESQRQNKMLDAANAVASKLAKEAIAKERREKELSARLTAADKRHSVEFATLEKKLSATAGRELEGLKAKADDLRKIVEGRGLWLSLRRVWQGKKDRDHLAELRADCDRITASMESARSELAAIHDREKSDLRAAHERNRFSDLPAEKRISYLERVGAKAKADQIRRTGQDRVAVHLADKEQQRARQAVWNVKEAEAKKDRQRQTDIERLAQRVTAESRQVEIARQKSAIDATAKKLPPANAKEAAEARRNDLMAAARAVPEAAQPAYEPVPVSAPRPVPERTTEAHNAAAQPSPAPSDDTRRNEWLDAANAIPEPSKDRGFER